MTRIGFVKRAILAPPRPIWRDGLYVFAAIAVPTLLRLAIDPLILGRLPYITYFPTVMLAAVLLGWRAATLAAVGSAIAANTLFSIARTPTWTVGEVLTGVLLFAIGSAVIIVMGQTLRRTVAELEATAKREAFLASELGHRAKNHLALIEALARQCQQAGQSPDAFFDALRPRIQTLARAQELLTRSGWSSCELEWLVEEALKPFEHHPGIHTSGPKVHISPATCTALIMVLNELATNAAKYGALSTPHGEVSLRWTAGDDGCLIEWEESGGPAVAPPTRRGLGSRLIARHPAFKKVEMNFRPAGVSCLIALRSHDQEKAA